MGKKYFGSFSDHQYMFRQFFRSEYDYETRSEKEADIPESFPTDEEVLFASYGGGSYDGHAIVIWQRNGGLYEAQGSHCSCYGLEGQFEAEETSVGALAMRSKATDEYSGFLHDHEPEAIGAYWSLVDRLQAGFSEDGHSA